MVNHSLVLQLQSHEEEAEDDRVFTFQNEGKCFRHKPGCSASRARLASAPPRLSAAHSHHTTVRTAALEHIWSYLPERRRSHQRGSDSHPLSYSKSQVQVFCLGEHVGML